MVRPADGYDGRERRVRDAEHPRAFAFLDQNAAVPRALLHFESELARMLGIAHPTLTPIVAIGRAHHRIPSSRAACLAK